MRIAFDQHIPPKVADAIKALSGEEGMLRVEIVSARQYATPKALSDVPWLEQFAKDGGTVVINGNAKMRGKLHEQKALADAGFIVFFFARKWNQATSYIKIPYSWQGNTLREVTPPAARRGCKPRLSEPGKDYEERDPLKRETSE